MSEREAIANFVNTTIQSNVSSGDTTIDVDTAASPYNDIPNPSSIGFLTLMDNVSAPTKWEVVSYTGRSAISGGFRATGVTRNVDSSTGSAQSFSTGAVVRQAAISNNITEEDLAANGGTIPETDRDNSWSGSFDLTKQGKVFDWTASPDAQWSVYQQKADGAGGSPAVSAYLQSEIGSSKFLVHHRFSGSPGTQDNTTEAWTTFGTNLFAIINGGGILAGEPTGGAQGNGTINAVGVYDDGSLLTDYVLDAELDGTIDVGKWDAVVPDRETEDEKGNPKVEKRRHEPARRFEMDELDTDKFWQKVKSRRKLPAIDRAEQDAVAREKKGPSLGESMQALVETCEVQAVHIRKLEERIKALES